MRLAVQFADAPIRSEKDERARSPLFGESLPCFEMDGTARMVEKFRGRDADNTERRRSDSPLGY